MGSEWQSDSLERLIDVKHGFAFAGEHINEVQLGDVLLSPGNFAIGGGFKGDKLKYYDGPIPEEFVLREGDLIVTMTDLSKQSDTLGYPAFVPARSDGRRFLHNQRLGKIHVKDRRVLDPRFLHYLLCSEGYRHEVLASATGTTVKHTSPERIRRFKFSRPPLPEQRAIAHILGTLDDKIELNRRMSETLEAIARSLFKSWFVDFNPVRAKMEGRWRKGESLPGLPADLWEVFPNRLVDSELGEIPEGWKVKPFSCCVDAVRGLSYKGSGLSGGGVPMHNLNSIYEGGGYKHDGLKHYSGEYKAQHIARAGDLIVANTEQGHHRLLIGYAAIVPSHFEHGSLFSHHIYRVRPKSDSVLTTDYLCHLLNTDSMHGIVSGYANGTTVNMLPINGLQTPLIMAPPSCVVLMFDKNARTARRRQEEVFLQSRTLSSLRDTLLPKLISGEIRVKDADKFVERAV